MCDKSATPTMRPHSETVQLPYDQLTEEELLYRREVLHRTIADLQLDVDAHHLAFTYYRRGSDDQQAQLHSERHRKHLDMISLLKRDLNGIEQHGKTLNPFFGE